MTAIAEEYLSPIIENTFVGTTYQVALINNPTGAFTPASVYANVILNEVTSGFGGYSRLEFTYISADIQSYVNGYPLAKKSAVFIHDGSNDVIEFSHVAIIKTDGVTYELVTVYPLGAVVQLSNSRIFQIDINLNVGGV